LTIIIPALNERNKIIEDILAATRFLGDEGLSGEVIVVVDGSTDDTFEVVSRYALTAPEVRVLPYSDARGKGAAIKRGVEAALGATIMFADAGMCVPYEDARLGLALLRSGGCEIAMGSRSEPETVVLKKQPKWRQMGSTGFRFVIQTLMGIPRQIGDTQCGFKLYRCDVARHLFAPLFTAGYMFDIEIILRALKAGYRISGFPVHWSNDEDSRYHPIKGSIAVVRSLVDIRMRLLFEDMSARPDRVDAVTMAGTSRRD